MPESNAAERRHTPRVLLKLIVRVHGEEQQGAPWAEITTTGDVSEDGLSLLLDRALAAGQVVRLQLLPPLPKKLGAVQLEGPSAEVWGVVRSARPEAGAHRVGVMFVDPKSVLSVGLESDRPERRQHERLKSSATFMVQQVDELGAVLKEALTVAANVSPGGAQLASAVGFSKGDVVVLKETTGAFAGRAEVTHTSVDEAGLRRLHLKFLDGKRLDPRGLAER